MALVGRIGEFNEGSEDFSCYVERLEQFFVANDIEEADKKRAVFLSSVGPKTYALVKHLLSPDLPNTKTYKEITDTLKTHFSPEPILIAERFKFYKRDQHANETISDFIVSLKEMTATCNFGAFLQDALRDRFVCGMHQKYERVQNKLLNVRDLTFKNACETALIMETAEHSSKTMHSAHSNDVNKVHRQQQRRGNKQFTPGKQSQQQQTKPSFNNCWRCGDSHSPHTCRYKSYKCNFCSKQGHLKRMCLKLKQKTQGAAHMIDSDNDQSADEDCPIYTIYTVKSDVKSCKVDVEIENALLTMEVDTGACVSVIPEKFYKTHLKHIPLKQPRKILKDYNGQLLDLLGEIDVDVKYKGLSVKLPVVIIKGDHVPLFGRNWMTHIKLDWANMFQVSQNQSMENLLNKHKTLFEGGPGTIKGYKASIRLKENAQPIFCKARPLAFALREKVEEKLSKLENQQVCYKVNHSNWATPIVNIMKSNGDVRICGDYKVTLNRYIDTDQYPLPTTEEIFNCLSGGKYFTKIDLAQAYQQLELDDEAQQLMTINTHKGLFRYRRLSYGISSAPAIFQQVMDQILQGIPRTCCRIDDIAISARSAEEHYTLCSQVLQRLEDHGIKLNRQKCEFMQTKMVFQGHIIDVDGIHPTSEKVEAIIRAPAPENVGELRSWLGLVNYYGKFLNNMATCLKPLYELLHQDAVWQWTHECQVAFDECKKALQSSSVLVYFDPNRPITLACDASSYGVGAVISHIMEDGSERPIAFASRLLSSSERNYAQLEKEALSLIFGVKKFHNYLFGRRFTLITDHRPLTTILGPKTGIPSMAAARMQRWALILAAYQYNIRYRCSSDHSNADALSRLPNSSSDKVTDAMPADIFSVSQIDNLPITAKDIAKATQKDPVLSRVYDYTLNGWPDHCEDQQLIPYLRRRNELSTDQKCVLWGIRVVVPPSLRDRLLDELHYTHQGISRSKALARSYFWWPALDQDIEDMIKRCDACQSVRRNPPKTPLHPWPLTTRVWQRIHIDYAEKDKQYLLIVIDTYSKWIEVFPVNSTTSSKTIDILRILFSQQGLPEELVSDNGPQFSSEEFRTFLQNNGICHKLIPPYHPSTNGAAERAVQTVKESLSKQVLDSKSSKSLLHRLANFLLIYRSTPHSVTGQTPSELFLKRQLRNRLTLVKPHLTSSMEKQQSKQIEQHDKQRVQMREFFPGERVRVRNYRGGKEKWILGLVLKRLGPLTYLVRVAGKTRYVHTEQMIHAECDTEMTDNAQLTQNQNQRQLSDIQRHIPEINSNLPNSHVEMPHDVELLDNPGAVFEPALVPNTNETV